jgi:hypothetical protein
MQTQVTQPAAPQPDIVQRRRQGIASMESAGSGDYRAIGTPHPKLGRPLGKYQIMEANIPQWSKEALGRSVTPDEFLANDKIQDMVFDHRFAQYANKHGEEGAARAWLGGEGAVNKPGRADVHGTSVGDYGSRFAQQIGGAGTQAMARTQKPFRIDGPSKGLDQRLTSSVQQAFSGLGIDNIRISSGVRSPEENRRVGGASKSRHLHSDAMDIDVSQYSIEQRKQMIRALSAAGVTGLGIGNNIIHADMGARRAWGYKGPAGGAPVPAWAKADIDAHLTGQAVAAQQSPIAGQPPVATEGSVVSAPQEPQDAIANWAKKVGKAASKMGDSAPAELPPLSGDPAVDLRATRLAHYQKVMQDIESLGSSHMLKTMPNSDKIELLSEMARLSRVPQRGAKS